MAYDKCSKILAITVTVTADYWHLNYWYLIFIFLPTNEDYISYSYQSFWSCDFYILNLRFAHEKQIYNLLTDFFFPSNYFSQLNCERRRLTGKNFLSFQISFLESKYLWPEENKPSSCLQVYSVWSLKAAFLLYMIKENKSICVCVSIFK